MPLALIISWSINTSMEKTNIDSHEARKRINGLEPVVGMAYAYARVERATVMPDGKYETDAEHAVSLAVIATAYAMKYHPELDPYKVFFYCVMHDVDEFLHGDTPTIGATAELFAKKDQEEAEAARERAQILKDYPEFNKLVDELSDLTIAENAFGKAFDKIAPGYTHAHNKGQALRERYGIDSMETLLESVKLTDEKMYTYASQFVDVLALRQEMHKKVYEDAFAPSTWIDVPLFDMP